MSIGDFDTETRATTEYVELQNDETGLSIGLFYSTPLHWVTRPKAQKVYGYWDGAVGTNIVLHYLQFNIFSGITSLKIKYTEDKIESDVTHCFLDLSPIESVNFYQWHGLQEIRTFEFRKTNFDEFYMTDTRDIKHPRIEFATVDNSQAERFSIGLSNAPKDDNFKILVQLNTLLEQARQLAAPYEREIRTNFAGGRLTIETDEDRKMMADIAQAWRDTRPPHAWMAKPRTEPPEIEPPQPKPRPEKPRQKRKWWPF